MFVKSSTNKGDYWLVQGIFLFGKITIFEVLTVVYIINASKQNTDYHLVEAGALFAKDSTNVFDFPLAQVIVNINKQHLNFLKRKTLDEVVYQKVGFLSNFTQIYVGKQRPNVLTKIKKNLKNNKSKINYPNTKMCQWFLDRMDGEWKSNKDRFIKKMHLMDANFCTTDPNSLNFNKK